MDRPTLRRIGLSTLPLALWRGAPLILLDMSWLVVLPASVWALATFYVPILGAFLNPPETWGIALGIGLLSGAALLGHVLAHLGIAWLTASPTPRRIPLYPFGDAAQVWPAASSAAREGLVASAGLGANLGLAGLAYLLWGLQLNVYLNVSLPFLIFFNLGLAAINLMPAFPLDGGRLVRLIWWGLLRQSVTPTWAIRLGRLLALLTSCWALYLLAQRARFSLATGLVTLGFAGLLLLGLRWYPAQPLPHAVANRRLRLLRLSSASLLLLGLLGITLSLAPTNAGLEMPGIAPSVVPMVEVPAAYRHPVSGRFLLTTVIQQTPILTGEWLFSQVSGWGKIVPPEQLVPAGTTPQQIAHQAYQMLEESEMTAIAVGLQQAGYPVTIQGQGVRIVALLPESRAQGFLQPDDVILAVNHQQIRTPTELTAQLRSQSLRTSVTLTIARAGRSLAVSVALLEPTQPNQAPRLGITIAPTAFTVQLPFPVKIIPQKIVGGPSAGLMFTLTVFTLVTPEDLTRGRVIAGTGTINLDGTVGPIGGVEQKVVGAELAGAAYFLVPPENYAAARSAAHHITVIKVATVAEAIQFLRSLSPQGR